MTQKELVETFRDECSTLAAVVAGKNSNYAGQNGNGAFHNFELIEHVTNGKITRELGCLVRLTDKLSRLFALLDGNPDAVGESFGDTATDLAGYALLLKLMYEDSAQKRLARYQNQGTALMDADIQRSAQQAQQKLSDVVATFGGAAAENKPASAWDRLTAGFRQ